MQFLCDAMPCQGLWLSAHWQLQPHASVSPGLQDRSCRVESSGLHLGMDTVAGGDQLKSSHTEEAPGVRAVSELSPHVSENLCVLSLYS